MTVILLLIAAYFLISLTALTDKFLLSKALPHPVVYAFFISTLGLIALILIPFGFNVPDLMGLAVALIAGLFYTFALLFLYHALRHSEVSRVFTTAGALGAVLTFIFSFAFLGERLVSDQILGFVFLLIGGTLMSIKFGQKDRSNKGLWFAILAAIAFAVSYTATKEVYNGQEFISGFLWIRIFAFSGILLFLFSKKNRNYIKQTLKEKSPIRKKRTQVVLFGGQAASAIGFLILNYVITLTSAAIALAAQGLQYLFLFIFSLILTKRFPKIIKEEINYKIILQKVTAIILIVVGLVILGVNQL